MGIRYTNLTLYGLSQKDVLDYLSSIKQNSYISPTENGFTVIYDDSFESVSISDKLRKAYERSALIGVPETHHDEVLAHVRFALSHSQEGQNKIRGLGVRSHEILEQYHGTIEGNLVCWATHLSAQFSCPALAVYLRDDSQFWYHLSQDGVMVDEYTTYAEQDWQPGQPILSETGVDIKGGDAQKLSAAFGKPEKADEVEVILRKPHSYSNYIGFTPFPNYEELLALDGFQDSVVRHQALAIALGMPLWWVISMSYQAIAGGEMEDLFEDYAPDGPSSKQAKALLKRAKKTSRRRQ
ncbi:MAG: hypothetical protein SFY66_00015 [Oculatellaceae cyanobacterium bins.114]|nr:hypothetical protein [Oculatellaceae cyanobacterium bins.114]